MSSVAEPMQDRNLIAVDRSTTPASGLNIFNLWLARDECHGQQ
jgi:hypothetical protein